jgi:hypothetical protein
MSLSPIGTQRTKQSAACGLQQTLYPDARLREVHLVASQSDWRTDTQAVPVYHQYEQAIACRADRALAHTRRNLNRILQWLRESPSQELKTQFHIRALMSIRGERPSNQREVGVRRDAHPIR